MNSKTKALKGYKAGRMKNGVFVKSYNRKKSIGNFKKTGTFKNVGTKIKGKTVYGLGHAAGEEWASKKNIDPNSMTRRYSKNSPSFDEGVYKYKQSAKTKAFQNELLGRLAK